MERRTRDLWLCAALAAAAAAAIYLPSLKGGFLYDDWGLVVDNPLVSAPFSASRLLASPYWGVGDPSYRPLTTASFALDARRAGMEPRAFHAVNVALHAADSALVVLLAAALGLSAAPAALCGLAFAALPVHVEAVDWIVGRSELLAAFFVLAAWLTLLSCRAAGRGLLGLSLFALALLSKESAAAFPAAFALSELAVDPEPAGRVLRRRGLVWLAVFAVLALYLEWRRLILGPSFLAGADYFRGVGRPAAWLTTARFFAVHWLGGTATGAGLCAEYWRPDFPDASPRDWTAWLALLSVLGASAWALSDLLRTRRRASLGALLFLVLALPTLGLVVPLGGLGADRFAYLPSVGFCLLAASLWPSGRSRRLAAAAACAALAGWTALTISRHRVWRSDDALWTATLACAPNSPRTLLWEGQRGDLAGRHAEARAYYERALAAEPTFEHAAFDEARSFYEEGRLSEAEARARDIIERRPPGAASTWCLLGTILEAEGRIGEAARAYERALAIHPGYRLAAEDLALLRAHFAKMGPR